MTQNQDKAALQAAGAGSKTVRVMVGSPAPHSCSVAWAASPPHCSATSSSCPAWQSVSHPPGRTNYQPTRLHSVGGWLYRDVGSDGVAARRGEPGRGKAGGEGRPGEHVRPPVEQQQPRPGAADHRQLGQAGRQVLRQVCRPNLANPGKLLIIRNSHQ